MYPGTANKSTVIGRYQSGSNVTRVLHSFDGWMESYSHKRGKDGHWLDGGPWYMWKQEVIITPSAELDVFVAANTPHYKGRFIIPSQYNTTVPMANGWDSASYVRSVADNLANRGAEAWNALRPDKPDFSLAQELMELRDLPGLFKSAVERIVKQSRQEYFRRYRRKPSKYTGAAFLEYQFGWLPLLRSIRDFVKAFRGKDKRLRQLIRDEGKPVRRRVKLKDISSPGNTSDQDFEQSSTTRNTYPNGYGCEHFPILNTNCYANSGSWVWGKQTITNKTWAVGRFRYHLPPGPRNRRWRRRMLSNIMGLRISAAELYAVMPWSWLADYFVDLGQFIEATSPSAIADRLTADYCYLMRQRCVDYHTIGRIRLLTRTGTQSANMERVTKNYIKVRIGATPFGFGVRQSDLRPTQIAIMSALGLSKL